MGLDTLKDICRPGTVTGLRSTAVFRRYDHHVIIITMSLVSSYKSIMASEQEVSGKCKVKRCRTAPRSRITFMEQFSGGAKITVGPKAVLF